MALSSTSGEQIPLIEAQDLVKSFRDTFPNEIKGSFIGGDNIKALLDQEDCIGIRCYHGYDNHGKMTLVMVGVDVGEKDMTDGIIMDRMRPCPDYCDQTSALYNV
jgi:hypothetical protein